MGHDELINRQSSSEHLGKLKICPSCGESSAFDKSFCHRDGTWLVNSSDRKICPRCRNSYYNSHAYCRSDGAGLVCFVPPAAEVESVLKDRGIRYGVRELDEEENDRFRRSVCPGCGSWNYWAVDEAIYLCKGCRSAYYCREEGNCEILGRVNWTGELVSDAGTGVLTGDEKTPMEKFLLAITPGSWVVWSRQFRHFRDGRFNFALNWPSFFFGPFRYFVKGLWTKGVLYALGTGLIMALLTWLMPKGFFWWYLISAIFFGVMGSNDYYRFCLKYIDDIPGAIRAKQIGAVCFVVLSVSPFVLLRFL